jgi:hypothetical protein
MYSIIAVAVSPRIDYWLSVCHICVFCIDRFYICIGTYVHISGHTYLHLHTYIHTYVDIFSFTYTTM